MSTQQITPSLSAEPFIQDAFRTLVELLSPAEASEFMYMGQRRQDKLSINLYKHKMTRRYLNIDAISLDTYRYDPDADRYVPLLKARAIAHVRS